MTTARATRQRLRTAHAVEVRVRCGRCGRTLGRLYGDESEPSSFSTDQIHGMLPRGARIDYFRRHKGCSADSPARWDKLANAYRRASVQPELRRRVITVPVDLC